MTNTSKVWLIKANGEKVLFSEEKLKNSLEVAGANEETIARILKEMEDKFYSGITTKEVYKKAFSLLREVSKPLAAKYKLKKAIQELGPSGYPFEKYIGEILKYMGYHTQVGIIVQGHCVQHEVDVIAEKEGKHFMIECKFHSDSRRKCDVKIPLYIHSRFLDVEKAWQKQPGHKSKFHQGWVVTNTRFSGDAIRYGTCVGLHLVGWDFPKKGNLKKLIDTSGLHPLTCLTTLTKREKQALLNKLVVLCKEVSRNEEHLFDAGVPPSRIPKVMKEAKALSSKNYGTIR